VTPAFLRGARRRLVAVAAPVVAVLICAGLSVLGVGNIAFLNYLDRFVGDWEVAALLPAEPQDPDIVIVAITDESLQRFPYSAPVDRDFLSDLLQTIDARGPRAIGLDVLLSQPTEPAKDDRLRRTLEEVKAPLVVSYADESSIVNARQRDFIDGFVPPQLRGLSALGADQFDTVRWIYPGHIGRDGSYVMGFDRGIAAAAGVETPPTMAEIVWHGRPSPTVSPFRTYPANIVAALPPQWLRDKIVLIGTAADAHRTPFATILEGDTHMLPAVEIHADGVAQFLHHTRAPGLSRFGNLAVAIAIAALGAMLPLAGWPLWVRIGAGAVLLMGTWVASVAIFHVTGVMAGIVAPTLAFFLSAFAIEALSGSKARHQREFITGAFSHYVSPKVVEALIRDPAKLSPAGERRVMTYLFTDIANFTAMSEALADARDLARILNGYFDGLTEMVLKYDGTVAKFEGDAVFVLFNAPMDQHDHAERAVRCALDINRFAETYRVAQKAEGVQFGHTRIGIHTGPGFVGNFGSRRRFDYGAQGDAVNIAARLEGVNKQFGTHICVSEATRALCHSMAFRPLGSVVVKGKRVGTRVWEPVAEGSPYLTRYCDAYEKLRSEAPEALGLFAALNQENPEDRCVALHLERLYRGESGDELVLSEK
jgi:class 3 adenylate cyclase